MIKEFRDFIAKGNVMDLAVGLIIGAAFTAIVKSMVSDLINPVKDGELLITIKIVLSLTAMEHFHSLMGLIIGL